MKKDLLSDITLLRANKKLRKEILAILGKDDIEIEIFKEKMDFHQEV